MHNDLLYQTIEAFRKSADQHLSVDEFMTSDDFQVFVTGYDMLFLEQESDEINKVYWKDAIFLLWDEELMTLEMYKDLEQLQQQISERQTEPDLPVYEDLNYYLSAVSPTIKAQIAPGSDEAKKSLAEHLSIPPAQLDYTRESLHLIDERLKLVAIDHAMVSDYLCPLSIYIGKTYIRERGGNWIMREIPGFDHAVPILSTLEKEINLFRIVYGALTAKHGAILLPTGIYRVIAQNPFQPHS